MTRTLISVMLAVFIMVMFASLRCFAYDYSKITGTNATGADISGYATAVQVNVVDYGADKTGKKDSAKAIQKALDYALENASNTVQVKVYFPKGKYLIGKGLYVHSNTWIYLEDGAEIVRNYDNGFMLRNSLKSGRGGYDGDCNIIIEGGCWNSNVTESSGDFSSLRFGHITNLWIKNAEFKDNKNGHHLEIGGTKNITIENCSFHGYTGSNQKEAIQLDTMNSSDIFAGFPPFDDTPCDNTVIRNNNFYDLMRGIGSHSATLGVYYTNTLITGNTFDNLKSTAIVLINHKNCIIENNVMNNVGYGIDFKYMTYAEAGNFHVPVNGYGDIYSKLDNNANTVIRNNTISTSTTSLITMPFAIQLLGRNLVGGAHPDYDYKIEGVKICDNTISTVGYGLLLNDTKGILISSNKISFNYGRFYRNDCNLISLTDGSDTLVNKNTISGTPQNAVYISGGAGNVVSSNNISGPEISAVYLSGKTKDAQIKDNTITSSGSNGIKVTKGSSAEVSGNTIQKSANNGIVYENSTGTVKNNKSFENGLSGLYGNSSDLNISENDFSKNKAFAMEFKENTTATTKDNNITDNSKGKLSVNSGSKVTLSAPKGLISSDVFADNLKITWKAVSEADGYAVFRKIQGSDDDFVQIGETAENNYVDKGLASKVKYVYVVKAYVNADDSKQYGNPSDELTVRTKASVSACSADIQPNMSYNGKQRTQAFDVTVGNDVLVPDIDYEVEYLNNVGIGTATVKVIGKGQYCGSKEFNYQISLCADKKIVATKRDLKTVTGCVSNLTASGYEIKVARNENSFYKLNNQTKSKGIQGGQSVIFNTAQQIKKNREYTISARSYRTIEGDRIYGMWL
ncbi:MAG: right-handed parallel beta-helix repeat-containing protein [Hominimerdicola sp.]